VQLITISFDPTRDTVDAINAFHYPISVDRNRSKKIQWSVLTTDNERYLRPILDGYSQAISKNEDTNVINHIVRIYLIDKTRNVRNIYGIGTLDPRLLITDVETLLLEGTLR
jgi:protein SCO1/2